MCVSAAPFTVFCEEGSICVAAYGHTNRGERLIPVTMKDVAGLVPGAYQGKGRGNRCVVWCYLLSAFIVHVLPSCFCFSF